MPVHSSLKVRTQKYGVIVCTEPGKTVQSSKEEADINTIVRRFGLTGSLPTNVRVPLNVDFSETVFDFQSAMNVLVEAENAFMQMPADVRARFGNDPARFVDFASDAKNYDEAVKLGLALPKPAAIIEPPVEVVIKETPK